MPTAVPQSVLERKAARAAAAWAIDCAQFSNLVRSLAQQLNAYGLVGGDQTVQEVLDGDGPRQLLARLSIKPADAVAKVERIRAQNRALALVQSGQTDEARALLEEHGVQNAAAKAARVAKRLAECKKATGAYTAALAAEERVREEVRIFPRSRDVLDRIAAAEQQTTKAFQATLAARRRFFVASNRLTSFDDAAVIDDDDDNEEAVVKETASNPATTWRDGCSIETT
jgi:hypothetical protein